MKIIFLITLSLFQSCSAIFWRKASLGDRITFSETGKSAVLFHVDYEEKNEWNPLSGTTKKKNYSTVFQRKNITKTGELQNAGEQISLPFWILNEYLYYNDSSAILFFLHGTESGYGTDLRGVSTYSFSNKIQNKFIDIGSKEIPVFILPSPSAKLLAVVYYTNVEKNFFVSLYDENGKMIMTPFKIKNWEVGLDHGIAWDEKSSLFYLRVYDLVFSVSQNNNWVPGKSKKFPECFFPGTSFASGYQATDWKINYPDSVVPGVRPIKVETIFGKARQVEQIKQIRNCK